MLTSFLLDFVQIIYTNDGIACLTVSTAAFPIRVIRPAAEVSFNATPIILFAKNYNENSGGRANHRQPYLKLCAELHIL